MHKKRTNGDPNGMKILLLVDRLDAGGAETHVETLARGLAERGHRVTVLSAGGRIADRLERDGIAQIRFPFPGRHPWRLLRSFLFLRRIAKRGHFDVLHAHTRTMGVLLSHLPSAYGAHIVTVHAARFGVWTRAMCRRAEVIAVSEDLRSALLADHAAYSERIRVIPNGIDTARFCPPEQAPAHDSVLFVSRLDSDCARGAECLLSCVPTLLRSFPHLTITIVGGGDAYASLAERAERINRRVGRMVVCMVGAVSDTAPFYRRHHVTVGVSRVALEGAACGCAVLLAGNEGYGGILRAEDSTSALSNFCCRGGAHTTAEALCADLLQLLSEQGEQNDALRAWVERDYSARRMTEETERAYDALPRVGGRARGKRLRVLIGGYAGCGNLGDDAILQGAIVRIRAVRSDIDVCALTGAPAKDRCRFGISCYHRTWLPSVLLAMLRADVFLLGGGSLLQDRTGKRSLAYYLFLLRLSHALCRRSQTLAIGLGPLCSDASERAVLRVLDRCDRVTLRDGDSLRWLVLRGFNRARLELLSDPATILPPPPPLRRRAVLGELGISPSADLLCVAVRPACPPSDTSLRVLAAAVRRTVQTFGLTPLFVVLDRREDADPAKAVKRLANCGGTLFFPRDAGELKAVLQGAALLVSMRLHALLFADSLGTPAIALSADLCEPKLASFAKHVGQSHFRADSVGVVPLAAEMERILSRKRK